MDPKIVIRKQLDAAEATVKALVELGKALQAIQKGVDIISNRVAPSGFCADVNHGVGYAFGFMLAPVLLGVLLGVFGALVALILIVIPLVVGGV